ncbi:MAG: hypothetical protein JSW27_17860 [Phycisphaerales bacterium]|nr:MAG: hypothetical protein JSW27_17860 [Phycisphaerales bacterium]
MLRTTKHRPDKYGATILAVVFAGASLFWSRECSGEYTGTIAWEVWEGIEGTSVADLTNNTDYPDNPTFTELIPRFEAPTDFADNFGSRLHGWLHLTTSGDYTFWIAADDNCELYLSTDDDPANKVEIAGHTGWTTSRQWDKYPSQQSAPVSLVGGQRYYIEALYKEGGGGDNLAVAWQGPDIAETTVIAGAYLSPWPPEPLGARFPIPADDAVDVDGIDPVLEWTAGATAVSHRVYLSSDELIDETDWIAETVLSEVPLPDLSPETTYYWRVDTITDDATEVEGPVWVFTTLPLEASFPFPFDDAVGVDPNLGYLSWTAGAGAIAHDVYFGETSPPPLVSMGQTETTFDLSTVELELGMTYYWQVHTTAPNDVVHPGLVWNFTTLRLEASYPFPTDGAFDVDPNLGYLSWTAGAGAIAHDVYFGETSPPPLVSMGQTETTFDLSTLELEFGTTYYWQVDEITPGETVTGPIWSFATQDTVVFDDFTASVPDPNDGASDLLRDEVVLSWSAGLGAVTHDVYLGTTSPPPLVSAGQTETTYDPGTLVAGTTYYWQIDEVDAAGTAHPGPVWSFSTAYPEGIPVNRAGLITSFLAPVDVLEHSFQYGYIPFGTVPSGHILIDGQDPSVWNALAGAAVTAGGGYTISVRNPESQTSLEWTSFSGPWYDPNLLDFGGHYGSWEQVNVSLFVYFTNLTTAPIIAFFGATSDDASLHWLNDLEIAYIYYTAPVTPPDTVQDLWSVEIPTGTSLYHGSFSQGIGAWNARVGLWEDGAGQVAIDPNVLQISVDRPPMIPGPVRGGDDAVEILCEPFAVIDLHVVDESGVPIVKIGEGVADGSGVVSIDVGNALLSGDIIQAIDVSRGLLGAPVEVEAVPLPPAGFDTTVFIAAIDYMTAAGDSTTTFVSGYADIQRGAPVFEQPSTFQEPLSSVPYGQSYATINIPTVPVQAFQPFEISDMVLGSSSSSFSISAGQSAVDVFQGFGQGGSSAPTLGLATTPTGTFPANAYATANFVFERGGGDGFAAYAIGGLGLDPEINAFPPTAFFVLVPPFDGSAVRLYSIDNPDGPPVAYLRNIVVGTNAEELIGLPMNDPGFSAAATQALMQAAPPSLPLPTPAVLIERLLQSVEAENLQHGIDNSLDAKLDAATQALADINQDNDSAAANAMQAFINAVEAQRDKEIPDAAATAFVAAAQEIVNLLGMP